MICCHADVYHKSCKGSTAEQQEASPVQLHRMLAVTTGFPRLMKGDVWKSWPALELAHQVGELGRQAGIRCSWRRSRWRCHCFPWMSASPASQRSPSACEWISTIACSLLFVQRHGDIDELSVYRAIMGHLFPYIAIAPTISHEMIIFNLGVLPHISADQLHPCYFDAQL